MNAGLRALAPARTRAAGVLPRRAGRSALVLGGLSLGLLILAVAALGLGETPIAPGEIAGMALQWLPVHPARTWSDLDLTIITLVRLPRILTAMLVGGALAAAGAAFQGLFRNPLADPGIVGTSAGASLGAILALIVPVQITWLGFGLVSVAAFAGALAAVLLVYALARMGGRLPATTLLLAGFAVSAMLNAVTTLVMALNDRLHEMYAWLLGNLDQSTAEQLLVAFPLLAAATLALIALSGDLNVLLLGDEQAQQLGLDVARRRLLILALGSLLTSVAVALSGLIAFVGLLVPHLARLLFGANHRLLLPASVLLGAAFLLLVDTVSRLGPQQFPPGLVTALLGGPWFIVLLQRSRGEYTF